MLVYNFFSLLGGSNLGTKEPTADTVDKDLAKSPTSGAETLGRSYFVSFQKVIHLWYH